MEIIQVSRLLFADDLEAGVLFCIGMQRVINCIKERGLKINVAKTKIMLVKKGVENGNL
jgi:hypothetical protein